jgi:hypothetical protein
MQNLKVMLKTKKTPQPRKTLLLISRQTMRAAHVAHGPVCLTTLLTRQRRYLRRPVLALLISGHVERQDSLVEDVLQHLGLPTPSNERDRTNLYDTVDNPMLPSNISQTYRKMTQMVGRKRGWTRSSS